MRLALEAGEETIAAAQALGVTGVPVFARALANEGLDGTLQPLRDAGLKVCQIGAWDFNPLSNDAGAQEDAGRVLAEVLPMAREAGCPYVVIPGGNYHPDCFANHDVRNLQPEAVDAFAEAITPFVEMAERHGAYLCIEPYLKTVIHSAKRFLELKERLPSPALRSNVDPTSLYDYRDAVQPEACVEETCRGLAGHYGVVHVKEMAVKEGLHVHIELVPVGEGWTDWKRYLELVVPHVADDGWIMAEHMSGREEAERTVGLLRRCADELGMRLD